MNESSYIPFNATREFTDRKEPIKLFMDALSEPQSSGAHRVLIWYGVGGQGKTALCNEFRRRIEARRAKETIAVCALDFKVPQHRSPVDAMLQIRLNLGKNHLIAFPTFDLAFAQLFAIEYPGDDIQKEHPGLYRVPPRDDVEDFLEWAGNVAKEVVKDAGEIGNVLLPGVGLLYKYGHLLVGRLRKWRDDDKVKKLMNGIENLTAIELREKLPVYLGFDLCRTLQAEDSPRVVLMIDTYEALWHDAPRSAMDTLRTDNWVRSFVDQARGTLVAIFCRDKLRWGALKPEWDEILDQHLLGGLSNEDAEGFLEREGIISPSVRERIVEGANGLPFYLDLALDQFEKIKAGGRQPVANDFASSPGEVLERFLDHLSEAELDDLRLASYPEEIDEELFANLCTEFFGGAGRGDWARLMQRSYMRQGDDGHASMHAVMREGLQAREHGGRPTFYGKVHGSLFQRYNAHADSAKTAREINETHDRALLAAARHLAVADANRLVSWIMEPRWQKFYDAGRWRALSDAFEKITDTVETLPASVPTEDVAWFNHHHAHICQFMGLNNEAKKFYERARQIYRDARGEHHPDYATILHGLADVCRAMGSEGEAATLYVNALTIYEAVPGKYRERHANVLFSLALLHEANGRKAEAETHFKKAQEFFKAAVSDQMDTEYANFLLGFARARQVKGRDTEAETLYREALQIYKNTGGDQHEGYATILLDLSVCLAKRGDRNAAEVGFKQAVSIHENALGPEHPNLGRALHLQAKFWIELNMHRKEATSQLGRAIKILDDSLGKEHVWTLEAREDLLRLTTDASH